MQEVQVNQSASVLEALAAIKKDIEDIRRALDLKSVPATNYEMLLEKYGPTLTFQQASEETGIFWQTIREMCLRGDIKAVRAGRKWILTTKAIADFLDGKNVKSAVQEVQFTKAGRKKIV